MTKLIIRMALAVCAVLLSHAAVAGPVRCSVNNQDSTCVGHITTVWQTAPTCPTDPGWTTVAAAQWIGSQYTAPQCNYQAPQECPSGFTQTSPPVWTGSNWTLPLCQPVTPQKPTIVSATGFWVWADCGSYLGGSKTGPIPLAVYKDIWSDGSTTYYQFFFGKQYPVSVDSQGRYYVNELGDNWDTDQGNGYPLASLYETAAGDPSASIPPQPNYACSGSNH
ncbi:hypothetical protein QFZ89_007868 [Paraburkholderia youngii]